MRGKRRDDPLAGLKAGAPKGFTADVGQRGASPPPVTPQQQEQMGIQKRRVGFREHSDLYEMGGPTPARAQKIKTKQPAPVQAQAQQGLGGGLGGGLGTPTQPLTTPWTTTAVLPWNLAGKQQRRKTAPDPTVAQDPFDPMQRTAPKPERDLGLQDLQNRNVLQQHGSLLNVQPQGTGIQPVARTKPEPITSPTPFVDQSVDELSHWFENLGKQEPQFTDVRNVNPLEGTVWHSDKDDRPLGSVVTSDDTPIPPFPKQDPLDMCSIDKSSIKDNKIADAEFVRETIPKLEFDSRIFQPTWALILRLLGTTAPTTVLEVVAVVVGLRLGLDRPRLTGDAAGADEAAGAGTVAVDREVLVGKADRVAAGKGEEGEKVDRGREAPVGRAGRLRVEPEVLARPHPLMSPSLGVVVRLLVVLAQALLVQAVDRAPSKPQVFLLPY